MAQTYKLGARHTTVVRKPNGEIRVTYHNTDVVTVHAGGNITLDTGGWRTVTTKLRMNQAANQFDLGFQVSQSDGIWSVRVWKESYSKPLSQLLFDERTITFNPKTGRKVRTVAA